LGITLTAGFGTRGHAIPAYLQGSQYLVWYFRALGAKIGDRVCLYPNGASPMMTEPDLVTIGDLAGVDHASLVAHINTKVSLVKVLIVWGLSEQTQF
jgi:hypothetical protein